MILIDRVFTWRARSENECGTFPWQNAVVDNRFYTALFSAVEKTQLRSHVILHE